MVLSTLEWPHSLQIQFSCFGREKAVIPDLGHGTSRTILSHYSVKADGFRKSDETGKDEPTTRPFNGNCRNNNVTGVNIGTKQMGEGGNLKKKAKVSGEVRKEKKSDEGVKKASKRGCLEQFGFRSQSSSSKKAKKEDLPNTESTLKVENTS